MIVLGIEGALGAFSAAVVREGEIVASQALEGNVALEAGLGLVDTVMREAGVDGQHLSRIAVGNGPGGFTGLRITLSYAKALAQAWRKPLVAVSSFDLLEYGTSFERALTVVVGRKGVISARLRDGSASHRASGWIADVLTSLLPEPARDTLTVIGAPEDVLAALAERGNIVEAHAAVVTPAAAAVALAAASIAPAPSIHDVRADYGELPAAKVPTLPKAGER